MGNRLKDEIRQVKPFAGLEHEALLNIRRTSDYLEGLMQQVLKERGLTSPQYNVLRILRGAGPSGLRCAEIGERMISRDSDITRLLDRLQRRGMVERRRDHEDRRVIHARIGAAGSKILKELDPIVEGATTAALEHMNQDRLNLVIDLMEEVRHAPAAGGSLDSIAESA